MISLFLKRLIVAVGIIGAMGGLRTVEQDTHALKFLLVIEGREIGDSLTLKQSGAHDEQCGIGITVEKLRVDHHIDRRTIDHYDIVIGTDLIKQVAETITLKQLCGIRGTLADRDDIEAFEAIFDASSTLPVRKAANPLRGEPT